MRTYSAQIQTYAAHAFDVGSLCSHAPPATTAYAELFPLRPGVAETCMIESMLAGKAAFQIFQLSWKLLLRPTFLPGFGPMSNP